MGSSGTQWDTWRENRVSLYMPCLHHAHAHHSHHGEYTEYIGVHIEHSWSTHGVQGMHRECAGAILHSDLGSPMLGSPMLAPPSPPLQVQSFAPQESPRVVAAVALGCARPPAPQITMVL